MKNDNDHTMLCAYYSHYGSPEQLQLKTVPMPTYGDKDVLIRVHYSSVNRTDCGFLRAKPFIMRFFSGLSKPKSNILGSEFSGEVVAVGNEVQDYVEGDRVFGFKDDDHGFGGHAQFTHMPEDAMMAKIPDQLSFADAAAGLEGACYALYDIRAAKIGSGHQVLVNGATGAIGSAALQIMHAIGADITAVCAKPYTDKIAAPGARHTVDYLSVDFTELDEQFDFVLDAVGKSSFGRCKRILKPGGIYTSTELGDFCQNPLLAVTTPFFSTQKVQFPLPLHNTRADAEYLAKLMEDNQYRPLVDRIYELDEIVDAFHYVETGEKIGNVLIKIPH